MSQQANDDIRCVCGHLAYQHEAHGHDNRTGYCGEPACRCTAFIVAIVQPSQQANVKPGTPLPWAWQKFGKDWWLTSQTRFRPIVLASNKGGLTSLVEGILTPFNPEHPDAAYIVEACNGYAKLLERCEAAEKERDTLKVQLEAMARAEKVARLAGEATGRKAFEYLTERDAALERQRVLEDLNKELKVRCEKLDDAWSHAPGFVSGTALSGLEKNAALSAKVQALEDVVKAARGTEADSHCLGQHKCAETNENAFVKQMVKEGHTCRYCDLKRALAHLDTLPPTCKACGGRKWVNAPGDNAEIPCDRCTLPPKEKL